MPPPTRTLQDEVLKDSIGGQGGPRTQANFVKWRLCIPSGAAVCCEIRAVPGGIKLHLQRLQTAERSRGATKETGDNKGYGRPRRLLETTEATGGNGG